MQRRTFIAGFCSAAILPFAARAQQGERVRRIGILGGAPDDDLTTRGYLVALREELARLGWIDGRNLRIDLRFTGNDPDRLRAYAAELVGLADEVIVASSFAATRAAQAQTKTIPIVFTAGTDPATNDLLQNIARPEGNTTGFTSTVDSLSGKWLELLKEAAPHVTRVAVVFNPQTVNVGYFRPIENAASRLGLEALRTPVRDPLEVVRAADAFAAKPNGGLLIVPVLPFDSNQMLHRVAAQYRLPDIHSNRGGVAAGGLLSYGTIVPDNYRRAAGYVDRLLRGAKVSELPVQFPTKFELVVNLKTAKSIGLTIPDGFLLRADELIE